MRYAYLYILSIALLSALAGKEITVLSYNVHALPAFVVKDSPETRLPRILSDSKDYDIIFIQENWIFSKRQLESWLPGFEVIVAKRSKFLPVLRDIINPNGSGLAIAVRDGMRVVRSDEILFDICSGWIDKANDCLASKGVLHARVETGAGTLDVYNTHLDAGGSDSDVQARKRQTSQMSRYIERISDDSTVILGGDLNIDFLADEFDVLRAMMDRIGLRNIDWRPDGSDTQYIDYIMYKGSAELVIDVVGSGIDRALDGLSDHPPIQARIKL